MNDIHKIVYATRLRAYVFKRNGIITLRTQPTRNSRKFASVLAKISTVIRKLSGLELLMLNVVVDGDYCLVIARFRETHDNK